MSQGDFIQLYSMNSVPSEVFLLEDGKVYFYVSESDKYVISGKNIIIGATEPILKMVYGIETNRLETAVMEKQSKIKKMSFDKFHASLSNYSLSLNVSMVIAKHVSLTNIIINKNMESLSGLEHKIRESAVVYYQIMKRLRDEYDKRKYPWLKEIISKFKTNLTYTRGEAFGKVSGETKMAHEVTLSDKYIEYSRGSILCEENTVGEEMFILKSGTIDVFIQENKVASISEPGTVFGEIALLLGEKRSATLKASNNVVITRIRKKEIREVAEKQSDFLTGLVSFLARRHYNNVNKIRDINTHIIEKNLADNEGSEEKLQIEYSNTKKELSLLKNEVSDSAYSHDADFLNDLVEEF